MNKIIEYVKPELVVLSIVLYFIGESFKKSKIIKNKYIPLVLGVIGIVLAAFYVLATSDLSSTQNVLLAVFTAIVQGSLVAGLSTYVDQIIKQFSKKE